MPKVSDTDDFEISRAVKERGTVAVQYEVLEESQNVRGTLTNWEPVFLQFRDSSGECVVFDNSYRFYWPLAYPNVKTEAKRCSLSYINL